MATLLQLHFAFNGPFGNEMAEQLRPLAETINQEPGFLWKVWTESEKNHEAGFWIGFIIGLTSAAIMMMLRMRYLQRLPSAIILQRAAR